MKTQQTCEVLFGIDTMAGWMNVSSYRVRKFISAGMPCTKIDDENGQSQWIFNIRAVNEWFYRKTADTKPKNPDDAD